MDRTTIMTKRAEEVAKFDNSDNEKVTKLDNSNDVKWATLV